jgi:hypothetical protein
MRSIADADEDWVKGGAAHPRVAVRPNSVVKGGATMGDKQKQPNKRQRGKKKLEINKETIQELSEQDLDQVAGGATATGLGEGVQRGTGPIGPTGVVGITSTDNCQ